ncbi:hypothetical protein HGB07_00290 [Candidatus Roizmanbacteria bacterium]|nr:hypothetical protein [Candidatus Roizmanbacteria bacterium]
MPIINELDIQVFFIVFFLTLVVNYILLGKLRFSLVDPIWIMVIINTTLTLTLVIYDRLMQNDFVIVIYLVLCQFFFAAGARFSKWCVVRNIIPLILPVGYAEAVNSRRTLWLLNASTFILVVILSYYIATGIPVFDSDPELARALGKTGGGGAIARLTNVFTYLSLTLWFYVRVKRIRIGRVSKTLGIALPFILLLSVGAKSSLISIYVSYYYVSCFISFETRKPFKHSAIFFVLTIISILIVTFSLVYTRGTLVSASMSPSEFATSQILQRIFFTGIGAYHYFSINFSDLNHLTAFDYFNQYLVLPLLAPLRLISYEPTVGKILAVSMVGDDTFGPNPSMYVEGIIFYGWLGGIFYCGMLGIIFSVFRYYPLTLNRFPSFLRVVSFSFGCFLVSTMTYDMILFMGDVYNTLFLSAPILIGVMMVGQSISQRKKL